MSRNLRVLAVSLLLVTAACAPIGPVPPTAPTAQSRLIPQQAMFAAESLYNIPAQAYVTARQHHLLSASLNAQIRPMLMQLYDALKAARAAYRLGNAAELSDRTAAMSSLSQQVQQLIPHS